MYNVHTSIHILTRLQSTILETVIQPILFTEHFHTLTPPVDKQIYIHICVKMCMLLFVTEQLLLSLL